MARISFSSFARLLVCAALVAVAASAHAGSAEKAWPTPKRWSWLAGTTWYVPPANLPAVMTTANRNFVIPLRDQTVYTIDGYADGYYWGIARTQFLRPRDPAVVPPDDDPTCNRMVASVTPEGTLNVSFAPMNSSTGERVTGVGTMRKRGKRWAMELQMTSGDPVQITHWAYMRNCPSGDCPLPAIDATAREFVEACRWQR